MNETRGRGPRARPRELSIEFGISTDSRRNWQLEPEVEFQVFQGEGGSYGAALEGAWNASQRLRLGAEVGYGRENGITAWASNEAFAPGVAAWTIGLESGTAEPEAFQGFDDGGLLGGLLTGLQPEASGVFFVPIYGRRDTRSVDVTLRGDLTFTPTLSLQFYGQLFAARGRYQDFQLLRARDELADFPSYPKTHDFAFSSFQTNTVLRWEYRPGSALFVVWAQNRSGDTALDAFDLGRRSVFEQTSTDQLRDTFDVFPTNVFLVKLSYKFLR